MDSELILKGVSFKYDKQWCLRGIDLELRKGEVFGLIGPNGSGKSTLLKIIDGLLTASTGEIVLRKKPLSSYKRGELARLVAMVPQESTFRFPFSVFEVVLMGRFPHLGLFPFEGKEDVEIAREAMQLTGTSGLADRSINELSSGEKQRVLIARALADPGRVRAMLALLKNELCVCQVVE